VEVHKLVAEIIDWYTKRSDSQASLATWTAVIRIDYESEKPQIELLDPVTLSFGNGSVHGDSPVDTLTILQTNMPASISMDDMLRELDAAVELHTPMPRTLRGTRSGLMSSASSKSSFRREPLKAVSCKNCFTCMSARMTDDAPVLPRKRAASGSFVESSFAAGDDGSLGSRTDLDVSLVIEEPAAEAALAEELCADETRAEPCVPIASQQELDRDATPRTEEISHVAADGASVRSQVVAENLAGDDSHPRTKEVYQQSSDNLVAHDPPTRAIPTMEKPAPYQLQRNSSSFGHVPTQSNEWQEGHCSCLARCACWSSSTCHCVHGCWASISSCWLWCFVHPCRSCRCLSCLPCC
jgi:hypothetical protein